MPMLCPLHVTDRSDLMLAPAAATSERAQLLCACSVEHGLDPKLLGDLRCDMVQRVAGADAVHYHPHGSCSDLLGWKVCHGCKQGERLARLACLYAAPNSTEMDH